MSDCGVCLRAEDYGEGGSIDSVTMVMLGRPQRCSECINVVPAGEAIEQADWYDDDCYDEDGEEIEEEKKAPIFTCKTCAEIADAFYCNGRWYGGQLWDSMQEVMGELNSSCFHRLTTPEAKAELQRRWMEWKGLSA